MNDECKDEWQGTCMITYWLPKLNDTKGTFIYKPGLFALTILVKLCLQTFVLGIPWNAQLNSIMKASIFIERVKVVVQIGLSKNEGTIVIKTSKGAV